MTQGTDRYARQVVLRELGPGGQARLRDATALLVGCGALGCTQAQLLARAGVGRLRIADRDFVELDNLQRQLLFDEDDVAMRLPKAEAAARKLRRINSDIAVEGVVVDVVPRNVEALLRDVQVVLDATDNIETRYLVNDSCVKHGVPWVYGGAVGCSGLVMAIRPGVGPCLRCLFPEPPPPGSLATCDVAGVLNTVPAIVASLQVTEALRLLVNDPPAAPYLVAVDLWESAFRRVVVHREPACRCCGQLVFDFLDAAETSTAEKLCGRNAVQLSPAGDVTLSLEDLAKRLAAVGEVSTNGLLLQLRTGAHELIVFPDGRAIIRGTDDPAVARSLYARYIGT